MCPELKILSVIFTRPAISRNPGLGSNIPSFTIFIVLYRFKFTTPRLEAYRIACVVNEEPPIAERLFTMQSEGWFSTRVRCGGDAGVNEGIMCGSMLQRCLHG
jgi:hypothetical protein